MRFIQKDINRGLLVFVIILLVLLTSFTIYYEVTFTKLSSKYKKYQDIFGDVTGNAVAEDSNKTFAISQNVQKYKAFLDKKYDELSNANNALKNQVESLNSELRLIKSQIEYQKAREIGPTENFRLFQAKIEENNKLRSKVEYLCSELKLLNASGKECS